MGWNFQRPRGPGSAHFFPSCFGSQGSERILTASRHWPLKPYSVMACHRKNTRKTSRHNWHIFFQPFKKLNQRNIHLHFGAENPGICLSNFKHPLVVWKRTFCHALWWSNVVTNLLSPCCGVFFKKATRSTATIPNLSGNTLLVWWFFQFNHNKLTIRTF